MGKALILLALWAMIMGFAWVIGAVLAVLGVIVLILLVVALICCEIQAWWISRSGKKEQSSGTV